jgi:branched-chain amino acid transport system ATP-binding protein
MLEISNLHAQYGAVKALKGVTLQVPQGALVGVLGANGSGKTTLMQAIAGLIKTCEGRVVLRGENIHTLPAHEISKRGLMLVPQGRMLFAEMTVLENLEMGAFLLRDQDAFEMRLGAVHEMFPILKQRAQQSVALSSKCWPLPGPGWHSPTSCCWMSHR